MPRGEVQATVDIAHGRADGLGELDQGVEALRLAADELGDDHRRRSGGEQIGDALQRRRVRSNPGRDLRGAVRRKRHFMIELLLLQPRVVAHVDGPARLGHHRRVGTRERLGHAVYRVRLIVPLRVRAHLLALVLCGVNPVDARTALRFVHWTRGADDEDGRAIDVGVVDRHVGVQQPDEVVQDRHHRPAGRLRVPVRDLHRRLLVLTEEHRRAVGPVVDNRVVEAPVAGAGIDRRVREVVRVQQVDDDVRRPAITRHQATPNTTHFSGLSCTNIASPTLVRRVGWRRESSVRAPTLTWKSTASPRNTF